MRWAGNVARVGQKRNSHRILVEEHEGKRQLRIMGCKMDDNIKMGLK
jgi:hypothetical protein